MLKGIHQDCVDHFKQFMRTFVHTHVELGVFLGVLGESEGTKREVRWRSVDWWCQIGLGGPGTCSTRVILVIFWV